jgi:hypothetical protein
MACHSESYTTTDVNFIVPGDYSGKKIGIGIPQTKLHIVMVYLLTQKMIKSASGLQIV